MRQVFEHENGFKAVLYGKSSMIIYKGDREVLHTGFRNVNTKEEVMECLETMPEFEEKLSGILNEKENLDENY